MNALDELVGQVDRALRTLTGVHGAVRPNPADACGTEQVHDIPGAMALDPVAGAHAAGLMRINHTGEVCAQALYEGQALLARDAGTRAALRAAAREEADHLAWCEARLGELDSRPSLLNPAFYAASFALGAATALLGDRVSLGFVEATEDQVCRHIDEHLEALPADDTRSREILAHMRADEARHGETALANGGVAFPAPVRSVMRLLSRVMTASTYRI
ncbi:MAG: 2-polyprenyl-3-methyl-6-methoxy-1,4-benzoquinone monooxygenase [Gammaproteobacteria bacterium]